MKASLELTNQLNWELNLDNFFNTSINEEYIQLLGWYSLEMEVLLFSKGYQVEYNELYKNYRYESPRVKIILTEKEND
jgi:hypothetical protein